MPCFLFLQTDFIHTVAETAGVTLKSHLSDSVGRQLSYPGLYKPGEGPRHLGAWGIPWVVCSKHSPPNPYMTFLNVLPLKTQPASTSDGSQSQQGQHCTPPCGTRASLLPLLLPSCLLGKGPTQQSVSEGNPLGKQPRGTTCTGGQQSCW